MNYLAELLCHVKYLLPECASTSKYHINYELAKNPQAFIPCMVYMMQFVESKGEKMMNVFPCRTDIVPKYIRFDTSSLIDLLLKRSITMDRLSDIIFCMSVKNKHSCGDCISRQMPIALAEETNVSVRLHDRNRRYWLLDILVLKDMADFKYKPKQKLGTTRSCIWMTSMR